MWKLLFSQGGTWAFVMIIYLYYNRPRKPQRGPCNVRGHTDATLPQGTWEAEGRSQDGLTLPRQMDARPPTASMWRSQASPPCAHTELAASQEIGGFMWLVTTKPHRLNHLIAQPHSDTWVDRRTHRDAPRLADLQDSPRGARQADALTAPAAWWATTKSSSLRPEMK